MKINRTTRGESEYVYCGTFDDNWKEESRNAENNYYRAMTEYYDSLLDINNVIIGVLERMSESELKQWVLNCPIRRD